MHGVDHGAGDAAGSGHSSAFVQAHDARYAESLEVDGDLVDAEDLGALSGQRRGVAEVVEVAVGEEHRIGTRLGLLPLGTSRVALQPRVDEHRGAVSGAEPECGMAEPGHLDALEVHHSSSCVAEKSMARDQSSVNGSSSPVASRRKRSISAAICSPEATSP